ncbi:hypothetical protein PENSPDRAFT_693353 [Peniophora sp. CONT]|nr:hypothetical protein PENSPDRAFT_693353 [Peniophora sp. CONT]
MADCCRPNNAGPSRMHTQGPRRASPERSTQPNPYTTLPPPTRRFITLYIKLQKRRQCFRIVEVPANYTFALLHTYIRFLFGLSDKRHYFDVVDHVQFHKSMKGHILDCGRWSKEMQEALPAQYMDIMRGKDPVMRVAPEGTRKGAPCWEEEFNWQLLGEDVVRKRSEEVTLKQIWNEEYNVCSWTECPRDCTDEEIAIKYENKTGGDHSFYISLYGEDPFVTYKERQPSVPKIIEAKGSCFTESHDWRKEKDPHQKKVDRGLKASDAFERYCKGELFTVCGPEKLEVFDQEEVRRRELEKREREREERERRERQQAEEGGYENDYDEGDSEEEDSEEEDGGYFARLPVF